MSAETKDKGNEMFYSTTLYNFVYGYMASKQKDAPIVITSDVNTHTILRNSQQTSAHTNSWIFYLVLFYI